MLIAHPTALGDTEDLAFVHAVALAARTGARLASVHVGTGSIDPPALPRAADLLRRWAMPETAMEHTCVVAPASDADITETLVGALLRLGPDLVITSTHPRSALGRLLLGSVAEGMARNLPAPTLLLPLGCRGFVHAATGQFALKRVLLPAASAEDARSAARAFALIARLAQLATGEIVLLRAAGAGTVPAPSLPSGFALSERTVSSEADAAILGAARDLDVDLIVMATRGHDAVADVLWGSHTERVLHGAGRPLLWVPAEATALDPR